MVFDLVRKETLLHDTSSYKYKWQKYLMRAIKAIFIGLFVALECFIFLALNEKIDEYSSYGIFDFLILFLENGPFNVYTICIKTGVKAPGAGFTRGVFL